MHGRRADGGRRMLRRLTAGLTASVVAATGAVTVLPGAAAAEDVEVLAVDLAASTGAVQGGASGMLYGLGDDGVPTDPIIAGPGRPTSPRRRRTARSTPTGTRSTSSARSSRTGAST